jgi:hypothetical protein
MTPDSDAALRRIQAMLEQLQRDHPQTLFILADALEKAIVHGGKPVPAPPAEPSRRGQPPTRVYRKSELH